MLRKIMPSIGIVASLFFVAVLFTSQTIKVRKATNHPLACINIHKMNMLYVGLDNPVGIEAYGYSPEQLELRVEGAQAKGGNGEYIINPERPGKATLKLFVKGNKEMILMQECRIRPLPDPEVLLGSSPGPSISRGELKIVKEVNATLGPAFAFEGVTFRVVGYTFTHAPRQGSGLIQFAVEGNSITPEIMTQLNQARAGDMIMITDVRVADPKAGVRVLKGSVYTVR